MAIMDKFGLAVLALAVLALGAAPVPGAAQASKSKKPSSSAPAQSPAANPSAARAAGQNRSDKTTPRERGVPEDYVIGAGDVLQISVWKEPDASVPSVVVRPDGKVAMPLLREVEVAGMRPMQAEKAITERLAKLINGVDVTVIVTAINSKKVY